MGQIYAACVSAWKRLPPEWNITPVSCTPENEWNICHFWVSDGLRINFCIKSQFESDREADIQGGSLTRWHLNSTTFTRTSSNTQARIFGSFLYFREWSSTQRKVPFTQDAKLFTKAKCTNGDLSFPIGVFTKRTSGTQGFAKQICTQNLLPYPVWTEPWCSDKSLTHQKWNAALGQPKTSQWGKNKLRQKGKTFGFVFFNVLRMLGLKQRDFFIGTWV